MYKFYEFFNPVLEVMKDGQIYSLSQIAELVSERMDLTEEQRSLRIKSGKPIYRDRIQWACTYLKQAGALRNEKRGEWQISERGLELLSSDEVITLKRLEEFPEFVDFRYRRKGTRKKSEAVDSLPADNLDDLTPSERIDLALGEMRANVHSSLLDTLRQMNPYKFEILCKDVLLAMGYGGGSEELSFVTQKSGDGGIDAVINQDPLGINKVYVQAKRFSESGEVRETDIRNFLGALVQKSTSNGVFITTGSFADSAINAIKKAGSNVNIVTVDGNELADLMMDYGVGVEVRKEYKTYSVDADYFDE